MGIDKCLLVNNSWVKFDAVVVLSGLMYSSFSCYYIELEIGLSKRMRTFAPTEAKLDV